MTSAPSLRTLGSSPRTSTSETEPVSKRWSREWMYFSLCIAAWCFTPLVRRLMDFRQGAVNPVAIASLTPFLLLLALAFVVFRPDRLKRLTPFVRTLAFMWAAIFAYGFLIAVVVGSVNAAAFSMVQYLVPMLGGLWLAGQPLGPVEALQRLRQILLPCAALIAVYGLLQWISPPPWDVLWVQGSEFISIGDPVPFAMRIFSTLNSPGTAGDFFALTIVLMLPLLRLSRLWSWPLIGALGAALLLTLVREAWVGLVVGTFTYLGVSPRRLAVIPSLAVFVGLLALTVFTLPGMMGSGANSDVIVSRLSTFGDTEHDGSALDRKNQYADAAARGLNSPIGSGLGTIGAASKLGANAISATIGTALDSGYFSRLLELGWLGTLAYLGVVIGGPIALGLTIFRRGSSATPDVKVAVALAIAVCAALAWGDVANDAHLGLDGFFFWIALGIGSLAISSCTSLADVPARGILLLHARLQR